MRMRKVLCTLICAASVVSTPVMAQSLSPSANVAGISKVKRIGATSKEESKLRGGYIIPIVAVIAIILGIVLLSDDDRPHSP